MAGQGADPSADVATLAQWHDALRQEVFLLVEQLTHPQALAADGLDIEDVIQRIDRTGVEARRLESLLARQIMQLESETEQLLFRLRGAQQSRRRSFWFQKRPADAVAQRMLLEKQVARGLCSQLAPTEALLVLLDTHAEFLKAQLPRCEPVLDGALEELRLLSETSLKSVADAQLDARMDALLNGVDLLQDLVDRIIDMIVSTHVLRNKLYLDAEERVVSLIGVSGIEPDLGPEPLARLTPLLHRARLRLLTAAGLDARRHRLNDVFRRRLAGSRQLGSG